MRIILLAAIMFLTIHFIRVDFIEGTIPRALSYESAEQCADETNVIAVTSIKGDTIASLFALYPDSNLSFIDRLELFYELNPSLKLQEITEGNHILLPITTTQFDPC